MTYHDWLLISLATVGLIGAAIGAALVGVSVVTAWDVDSTFAAMGLAIFLYALPQPLQRLPFVGLFGAAYYGWQQLF